VLSIKIDSSNLFPPADVKKKSAIVGTLEVEAMAFGNHAIL
jgi:hypothetical protein